MALCILGCHAQWGWLCFLAISTSAASLSFNCRASTGQESCSLAFDKNLSSAWVTQSPTPQWVEATAADGEFFNIGSYSLTMSVAAVAPRAWLLEGVERDFTKATLDLVSEHSWQDGQTYIKELTGLSSFRSYRLTVLEGVSSSVVAVTELGLSKYVEYSYDVGEWSPCSVTCGGGTQQRKVLCKDGDGVTYNNGRCGTEEPPAASRSCGQAACACKGGLACNANCADSSRIHPRLGCQAVLDGLTATSWTSTESLPQWLEFDLGETEKVVALSMTVGTCDACALAQAPSHISLQAAAKSGEWQTILSRQSVGSWTQEETKRWQLSPTGPTFRFWRLNLLQTFGVGSVSVAEVGLFAPTAIYRLVVGGWGSCVPLGGEGACGAGVSTRSVICYDPDDVQQPVHLCFNGTETATEKPCSVTCPELNVQAASAHPGFFGVLRVQLTTPWIAHIFCAAYQVPMGDRQPSAPDLDLARYTGKSLCTTVDNCTVDIKSIAVDEKDAMFEVRCKVVGGFQVFGQGRVSVLRPVPTLLGCYADAGDRDLPKHRGETSQVDCADKCFGFQYFGMQNRGDCYCGNSYGKYGEQIADRSSGILGCDCDGPYYAYWANCVWEQTSGRYGDDAKLAIRLVSFTTSTAKLHVVISPTTKMHCDVTTTAASEAAPNTTGQCDDTGCNLVLTSLKPATTYEVTCKAEPDAEHRYARSSKVLVTTLEPYVPPPPRASTRAPLTLGSDNVAVFTTTVLPEPVIVESPVATLVYVSLGLAFVAVPCAHQCCAGRDRAAAMEALDLPHFFWLLWELFLAADLSLGVIFLQMLLFGRSGLVAHWDLLSEAVAGALIGSASLHGIAFVFFGLLPSCVRSLATRLASGDGANLNVVSRQQYRAKRGQKQRSSKSKMNHLAAALPEAGLDAERGPSSLHFLPVAGILAICASSSADIRVVAARKVGLRSFQLLASGTQSVCAGMYLYKPGQTPASTGVAIACLCMSGLMLFLMVVVLVRARRVASEGVFLLEPDVPPAASFSSAEEPFANIEAPSPVLDPKPKRGGSRGTRGRRPQLNSEPGHAFDNRLRTAGKAEVRGVPEPSLRIAPKRGEAPKPLPEKLGSG